MEDVKYFNYHKHTHYSNLKTLDCIVKPEEYMKRAIELGHTSYSSCEHGWQGNLFEAYTLCQKYNLKLIYAVEAYYVDNMEDKFSRTNYHIMLIALTKNAQKEINTILSKANTDGFYYKPRIDLKCLLSLNPKETIITTACIAGRMFKPTIKRKIIDYDKNNNPIYATYENKKGWFYDFLKPVHEHFKDNFYLEVQDHKADVQKEYNKKILTVSRKFGIKIIHANDSHYIYPEDAKYRNMFLKAKDMNYGDEDTFILDYPSGEEILKRYAEQGILTEEEAREALRNTLELERADGVEFDKEFKIPKVPNEYIREELHSDKFSNKDSFEVLEEIVNRAWSRKKGTVKAKNIPKYEEAIKYELDIIKKCGMADYFVLDHMVVNRAVNKYNAILTRSGRGSAVSFLINHLLGLTEVDRIKAPIKLYPTRFMSAERILQSLSLPDIDLNFSDTTPVVQATKDILGKDNIYYMVAYKPLQKSSAFRLWCKAKGYKVSDYENIGKELAVKGSDDEEICKRFPMWAKEIKESVRFRGVIESVAPSPCSFLLLSKSITSEIGLMRVGKEDDGSGQNFEICCCLDGYNCDVYKYLKNDYLTVTIYRIISEVYKLIGRPIDDIATLINNCDNKVWEIYEKGLTTTINQADSDFGKQTVSRYKPKSLAELSAWVASIRPAFASLLNNFLDRKPYTTGVKQLDEVLKDSFHYLLYQESIMAFLVWLGIEEKETYDIIKKISKKKFTEQELNELKEKLIVGWIKNVGSEDGFEETWQVVEDASRYAFNASHSLSVAIDSLYGAYLKSHYPLEYFSVVLSIYADDIVRTSNLISELPYFNIKIMPIKFGKSLSDYTADKENNLIYKGIKSIKYCNETIAGELFELSKNHYDNFIDLIKDIKEKTSVNSKQFEILIKLNFFSDFGGNQYLLNVYNTYDKLGKVKIIKKDKLESLGISEVVVKKFSEKETAKQYSQIDNIGLVTYLCDNFAKNEELKIKEQVKADVEYLGYTEYKKETMLRDNQYIIVKFKAYANSQNRPYVTLHNIKTGEEIKTRIRRGKIFSENPFGLYSVLEIPYLTEVNKKKFVDGEYVDSEETELILEEYSTIPTK